ncbi:MAG: substrate-binding domain-containing protein [Planctomycetes bacterium]|nr:substrate-binding domain-containing protein [Planctomycetota bacterium]
MDRLLRELVRGTWQPGASLPPRRQLCEMFGVSQRPMQEALQEACRLKLFTVSERRPTHIEGDALERAQALLAERAERPAVRRLALLIPDSRFPLTPGEYWQQVSHALTEEAAHKGIRAEVVSWPYLEQITFAEQLATKGFGAAIALGTPENRFLSLYEMAQRQFPVLLHNRRVSWLNVPSLIRDDFGAMRRVGQMMAAQGHRNLCLVTNDYAAERERLLGGHGMVEGWMTFLRESGLKATSPVPVHVVYGHYDCIQALLESRDPPTGLVLAFRSSHQALTEGFLSRVPIPDVVSVAMLDSVEDIPAQPWRPPLTSITLDMPRMAQCAVELIERMLGGEIRPPSIRVPLNIAVTDSIGPAPHRSVPPLSFTLAGADGNG